MMKEGVFCFLVCFGFTPMEPTKDTPVDSFCTRYAQVVLTKAEVEQVLKLPRSIRDRIQGNDLDYLCQCKGWATTPQRRTVCASIGR